MLARAALATLLIIVLWVYFVMAVTKYESLFDRKEEETKIGSTLITKNISVGDETIQKCIFLISASHFQIKDFVGAKKMPRGNWIFRVNCNASWLDFLRRHLLRCTGRLYQEFKIRRQIFSVLLELPASPDDNIFGWSRPKIIERHDEFRVADHGRERCTERNVRSLAVDHGFFKCLVGYKEHNCTNDGRDCQYERIDHQPTRELVDGQRLLEPPRFFLARLIGFLLPGVVCGFIGFILLFGPHRYPSLGASLYLGGILIMTAGVCAALFI